MVLAFNIRGNAAIPPLEDPMDQPRITDHASDYLRVDSQPTGDERRVRLVAQGELDSQTSTLLIAAVNDLVTRRLPDRPLPDSIVLDLGKLTFIDAAGVRCLLQCETVAGHNGVRLEPGVAHPAVVRILDIVGLARHFGFVSSGHEANRLDADEVDELLTWSLRARRQAHDICLRAWQARQRSTLLRDIIPARPTR
jgi:anti-anti-sigma factor